MGRLSITEQNTKALVTFQNVSKSFGATKALIDCNIDFKKGEIHSLVGENGAGKSTLGKIILGAYKLDSGKTYIDDEEVTINSPGQAVKIGLVGISQELSLLSSRTVVDNIAMGRELTSGIFISAKKNKVFIHPPNNIIYDIKYDTSFGYPKEISIDWSEDIADDEVIYYSENLIGFKQ